MPLTSKGFPLFLTFDLDAETMWTGRDPAYASRPILMSQGAYGWKVGTGRVLDLLDRYGIKATFFVPGLIIDQREALILVGASGFSYEDAATICGCAVGTIKSRVNRARTRLADLLAIDSVDDFGPDRATRAVLAGGGRS